MVDDNPNEDIGQFIMNLFYEDPQPNDAFPPYIMLYANHAQFFTEQTSAVFQPIIKNPNLIKLIKQLANDIIYDASLWNYKFELSRDHPLILGGDKSPTKDLQLSAHHGDGRKFYYHLVLEEGSVIDVNHPENLSLLFNTPDSPPPALTPPILPCTSVVHVTVKISSHAAIPIINSDNLLLLTDVPVELTSLATMIPSYPQKAKVSGFIDLRSEPYAMSLTFMQERDSIVPGAK